MNNIREDNLIGIIVVFCFQLFLLYLQLRLNKLNREYRKTMAEWRGLMYERLAMHERMIRDLRQDRRF